MEIELIRKAYRILLAYWDDHYCVEDCKECAAMIALTDALNAAEYKAIFPSARK